MLRIAAVVASIVTLVSAALVLFAGVTRGELGSAIILFALGLLGVTAGFLVYCSSLRQLPRVFAWVAMAFALAYLVLIYPVFLGVGHVYGPTAILIVILAAWNLVNSLRKDFTAPS